MNNEYKFIINNLNRISKEDGVTEFYWEFNLGDCNGGDNWVRTCPPYGVWMNLISELLQSDSNELTFPKSIKEIYINE